MCCAVAGRGEGASKQSGFGNLPRGSEIEKDEENSIFILKHLNGEGRAEVCG